MRTRLALALLLAVACAPSRAALPPVPVPPENPITEPKRVLGKILFWDEQLSSNGTVACGTCHRPAAGGADPRAARHPGIDKGTIDDVHGSPGIVALNRAGAPLHHPVFGDQPQVTTRLSPANFMALWAEEVFWDGRAGTRFKDPLSGKILIERGGALENQALFALLNDAEMATSGRTWRDVTTEIAKARPLALATNWPPDTAAAIARASSYPALFAAAFGDAAVTPSRIAFAIATYQRTLVADQTPFDRFEAGDESALSGRALHGWRAFQSFHCNACHTPPLFTNNDFFQVGLRRADFDRGRANVTNDPEDAGEMKVPSLRNAALRPRFMHTGEFTSLAAAIRFYINTLALPERDGIPGAGLYTFNMSQVDESDLREFIATALTDPRVRDETFPFDRPILRSERQLAAGAGAAINAAR
jgi:cytochrome c peroxidase